MKTVLTALVVSLALAGCHSKDEPPPVDKPKAGRAETQSIRNTQAIGYDGKAIADKVDKGLNQNDEHLKDVQKAVEEQDPGSQP